MRTSLRSSSSSLCSVQREILAPPMSTGSRIATGVSAPERVTLISMSRTVVVAWRAGNL